MIDVAKREMPDLVSIVVNCFNYEQFVGAAIESALRQSYREVEVIVVDDGSVDGSRAVIEQFADRVQVVLKENQGQASAFNAGFLRSRGGVVIFLDADDLLLPSAAEAAWMNLQDSSFVKFHWLLREIDEAGRDTGRLFPRGPLAEGDLGQVLIRRGPVSTAQPPTSGNAWARWFLDQVMPLPEHEDKHGADGFLRILAPIYGLIRRAEEPHGCYRFHGHNYGAGRGLIFEFSRGLRRYQTYCRLLREHLERQGRRADFEAWTGPESHYAWLSNALGLHHDIAALLPEPGRLIVVDDEVLGPEFFAGHQLIPFLKRGGRYRRPDDDQEAIAEMERLREEGTEYLVFAFTAFWWLEAYPVFHRHLSERFRCIARNQRVIVFDLRDESAGAEPDRERPGALGGGV